MNPVFLPVRELAEAVRARRISPVELAETFLDRLERLGPRYNAVVTLTRERALVQARRAEGDPAEFEFFLNNASGELWRCRRNLEITRPVEEISLTASAGIPILAPEIQLLYKAKGHRPKDEHDFRQALPRLDAAQRAWLKAALPSCYGEDPWIAEL